MKQIKLCLSVYLNVQFYDLFFLFMSMVLMESMPMIPFQQEHTINKSNFQPQN